MAGMFDSDYEGSFKITNVNNFIKAFTSGLVEVVKGTREAVNNGEPVVLEPGRIRPVNEPTDEPTEANTAKVDNDVLEELHKLADALEKARDCIPTTITVNGEDFALKAYVLDFTGTVHTLLRTKR